MPGETRMKDEVTNATASAARTPARPQAPHPDTT